MHLRTASLFLLAALSAPLSLSNAPITAVAYADEHADHDLDEDDYDDTEHPEESTDIFACLQELKVSATPEELPKLLEAFAAEYPEINVISPVQGRTCRLSGRRFGCYNHPILKRPRAHLGLDLTAPAGTRLVTPMDNCFVLNRTTTPEYGRQVFVRCGIYTFHYSHLLRWEAKLKLGAKLKKGTVVGYVGSTGLSSGPHLHFEVRQNGTRINPEHLFDPDVLCKEKKRLQTQVACVTRAPKKAAKGKAK